MGFLHERSDFKKLIEITAQAEKIDDASLVEKDYWIMHCLYGLQQARLNFELKGGTSLSKGFGLIDRFSEDIDIRIEPQKDKLGFEVYSGKNHDKPNQIESRKKYFDWLTEYLKGSIPGLIDAFRDEGFDDTSGKYRNGGIRLVHKTEYSSATLKDGILLEVGFDKTQPNRPMTVSSWVFEQATKSNEKFTDNIAKGVLCYEPQYTFVEKLQAVVKKYRQFKDSGDLPPNFLRHYYDLFKLIDLPAVQSFIGTSEYEASKKERFRSDDTKVGNSGAFVLSDKNDLKTFEREYLSTKALYFRGQPSFEKILERIGKDLHRL